MPSGQVQAETGQLQRAVIEAVAGWRNYALTRDERQLENLRSVVARVHKHLATLKEITADNALQHERIAELEQLLIGPLTRVTEILATPDAAAAAAGLPAPPRAQPANEALIRIMGQINDEEQALNQEIDPAEVPEPPAAEPDRDAGLRRRDTTALDAIEVEG